jgi:LPPG:FO 2-phospho-L-lactate transferase
MSAQVVALCGGIGGAKLALGLYRVLPRNALTVIVNTGDDFEHLGLSICPDVDTTLYTLAGLANPELGWGRRDETWTFMRVLESLGAETWFRLGDGDLALHVERTQRLRRGETLSAIIASVGARFGVTARVVPMSDDPVRTRIATPDGELAFQDYFVRRRCEPRVTGIRYENAASVQPAAAALSALASPALTCVVICPSNPYLSVDPLLAIPELRAKLSAISAPVIAVTPLVGGAAIKGPTAKIMRELDLPLTPLTVAHHYGELLDGFVLDEVDRGSAADFACAVQVCDTVMVSVADRERLAREVLAFAAQLRKGAR